MVRIILFLYYFRLILPPSLDVPLVHYVKEETLIVSLRVYGYRPSPFL